MKIRQVKISFLYIIKQKNKLQYVKLTAQL